MSTPIRGVGPVLSPLPVEEPSDIEDLVELRPLRPMFADLSYQLPPLCTRGFRPPMPPVSMVVPDDVAVPPPPLPEREISAAEMQLADSQMQGPVWEVRLLAEGGRGGGGSAGGSARDVQVIIPSSVMHRIFSFVATHDIAVCVQVSRGFHRVAVVERDAQRRLGLAQLMRQVAPSSEGESRRRIMEAEGALLAGEILPGIPQQAARLQGARSVVIAEVPDLDASAMKKLQTFACQIATIDAKVRTVRTLADEEERNTWLALCGFLLAGMIEPHGTEALIDSVSTKALRLLRDIDDDYEIRRMFVQRLLATGREGIIRVRTLAERMPDGVERERVFKDVTKAFLSIGDIVEARTAEEGAGCFRAGITPQKIRAYLAAGHVEIAIDMATKELRVVQEHPDRLLSVIEWFAQQGEIDRARELATMFDDDGTTTSRERLAASQFIAIGCAKRGAIDSALVMMDAMSSDSFYESTLSEVVDVVAGRGEIDRALELARGPSTGRRFDSSFAHHKIVKRLLQAGELEKAREVIEEMPEGIWQRTSSRLLAKALAEQRKFDEAFAVVTRIPSAFEQKMAIAEIIQILVTAKELTKARALVGTLSCEMQRAEGENAITRALLTTGEVDIGVARIDAIRDERSRLRLLHNIVQTINDDSR